MHPLRLLMLLLLLITGGCASVSYYAQAVGGQLEILARTRPIDELLDGSNPAEGLPTAAPPPLPAETRERLRDTLAIRAFASNALALPDNGSYRSYADLGRPYVAWTVIATPELSLEPQRWCFPFAGCVPYRGYFEPGPAARFAAGLRARQLDVRVAPVSAYSTLGWFRDPILASQLKLDDTTLAAVIFHELAHQRLYVPGDAGFNESFATAVEIAGVQRWLDSHGDTAALADYRRERARRDAFVALVLDYRQRLAALYASDRSVTDKRREKSAVFGELRAAYGPWQAHWGEDRGYAAWFAQELNNAHLATVGLYHQHVPAFLALLDQAGGDFQLFYRLARGLGRLPPDERTARLAALAAGR